MFYVLSAHSPSLEILYGRFISPYTYFIVEPTDKIYVEFGITSVTGFAKRP
jgi:hypothetical protein